MFFIQRDVSYGQFANCLAVLHIGYTAIGVSAPKWLRRRGCYAARLEIATDGHRFRFSGFSLERRRAKLYAAGGRVRSDRTYIVGETPQCEIARMTPPHMSPLSLSAFRASESAAVAQQGGE